MKKLTNTLYMIIVLLMFGAAQSATAQIRTTSSASLTQEPTAASLAQEPTATISAPAQSNVGHFGYKSGQTYTPTIQGRSNSAAPVVSPVGRPKVSGGFASQTLGSSKDLGSRNTNSVSLSNGGIISNGPGGAILPPGEGGEDPLPGGTTVVPMGNTVVPLIILLLCYALFLLVRGDARKDQEEAA